MRKKNRQALFDPERFLLLARNGRIEEGLVDQLFNSRDGASLRCSFSLQTSVRKGDRSRSWERGNDRHTGWLAWRCQDLWRGCALFGCMPLGVIGPPAGFFTPECGRRCTTVGGRPKSAARP
jgi:hypothetical protein